MDGASIYLEDDHAKVVLGPDTGISRAREGVLSTSALQLGTVDACSADEHKGTLRFDTVKEKLQVCTEGTGGGVDWKTAGGAKFEPIDQACDDTTAGLIRFQSGVFEACDGSEWFVVLGQPTSHPTRSPTAVPKNMASPSNNPEVAKSDGSGMNSYNFDGMVDGSTPANSGHYQAYYAKNNMPSRVGIDLGKPYQCSSMRFFSVNTAARPKYFQVQYSSNPSSGWQTATLTGKTDGTTSFDATRAQAGNSDSFHGVMFAERTARYWAFLGVDAVYNNGNNNAGMNEIEFYCTVVN